MPLLLMKTWNNTKQLSNHSRVLRYIFRNQPVSRSEIVEDLSLPRSLVTSITASLISQGIVTELGKAEALEDGTLGRRRLLIGICPEARFSIGVEIGTRHFRFCLTDLAGKVHCKLCYAPSQEQIDCVNQSIVSGVRQLLEESGIQQDKVLGVGVALPGHLNQQSGHMVTHSSLWGAFNAHLLEDELGLPVTAENNVRAMAYEKYLFDIQSCPEDFALLHVGAGIFCADFRGGVLAEGSYISGEIGHTISNPDGQRCECGKTGCLQTYASESWLIKKAQRIWQYDASSILRQIAQDPDQLSLETVMDAYRLGDPLITREIREALRYLGIAAANITIILGVKKLYLHSRMFQEDMLRNDLQALIEGQLSFVGTQDSEDVSVLNFDSWRAAVGASALAIDRLFISRSS